MPNTTDPKIVDAVRTIGHLLEHHGTDPETQPDYAYDKQGNCVSLRDPQACTFCAYGAGYRVAENFDIDWSSLSNAIFRATGERMLSCAWDGGTPDSRRSFYLALQNFNG